MGSYLPTVHLLTRPPSHQPTMEEDNIVSNLSDKSRSLRKTSVKKRLETELKKVSKRRKEKICKKPRLNKYQRKVANAKERERMKRMNEEYERLKKVVPMEQLNSEDGKDKKVSILRSAILYIQALKQLISDCDAGLVDSQLYSTSPHTNNKLKIEKKQSESLTSKVKASKRVILDPKWTHYSQQFLQDKFSKDSEPSLTSLSDTKTSKCDISLASSSTAAAVLSELSLMKTLPNIEDILGSNLLDTPENIVTVHYHLIEDSSRALDLENNIDMEHFTNISEYSPCLSL